MKAKTSRKKTQITVEIDRKLATKAWRLIQGTWETKDYFGELADEGFSLHELIEDGLRLKLKEIGA